MCSAFMFALHACAMSGFSLHRKLHLDHAANPSESCLWMWSSLRPVWMLEQITKHSFAVLESWSVATFLGNAAGWITLSREARRFRWVSRQWCTVCGGFASGRPPNFTLGEVILHTDMYLQRMYCICKVHMCSGLVEQAADPLD